MGKIVKPRKLITAIGIVLCLSGGVMSCKENSSVVVIEGPTKVLAEPECSFYKGVKEFTVLDKGETVQVIGVKYPKDCMVYQIKLTDGRVGYITHGDHFKVIEGQKK